jgi:hypothetical protein
MADGEGGVECGVIREGVHHSGAGGGEESGGKLVVGRELWSTTGRRDAAEVMHFDAGADDAEKKFRVRRTRAQV